MDPVGTRRLLTDRSTLESWHLHFEVHHLLEDQFQMLNEEEQQLYFAWALDNVDIQHWVDTQAQWGRPVPTEAECDTHRRWSELRKLWPVRAYLSEQLKNRFNELLQEFGDPDHPDLLAFFTSGLPEAPSPLPAEQIGILTLAELVDYLNNWNDPADTFGRTASALADELAQHVAKEPDRYTSSAALLLSLPDRFISAVLAGLARRIQAGDAIEWQPVLATCRSAFGGDRVGRSEDAHIHAMELVRIRRAAIELVHAGLIDAVVPLGGP